MIDQAWCAIGRGWASPVMSRGEAESLARSRGGDSRVVTAEDGRRWKRSRCGTDYEESQRCEEDPSICMCEEHGSYTTREER